MQMTYCKRFDNSIASSWPDIACLTPLLDIASSYQLRHREFMNIKRMLSRNGYPDKFLDRCIQQFLNRKYVVTQQRDTPVEPSPSPKYTSLQLPYLDSISKSVWRELSSFIKHKAVVNVKRRCFQSTRKLQSWFSVKDRQALLDRFNVVYKLTCSCGASYIGQTQRNLINRSYRRASNVTWLFSMQTLASQPRSSRWLSQPWGYWQW